MGYNGDYLESLIKNGNKVMIKKLIAKGTKIDYELLNAEAIHDMRDEIDSAILKLKSIKYKHFKAAKWHAVETDYESKMDHYLAIDNILKDNIKDEYIGIDWTVKPGQHLLDKIDKHKWMKPCHNEMYLDKTVVVYVYNADTIPENKTAKFVFRALKCIAKEVNKKDFQGGMTIDAKEIMK